MSISVVLVCRSTLPLTRLLIESIAFDSPPETNAPVYAVSFFLVVRHTMGQTHIKPSLLHSVLLDHRC